MSLNEVTLPDIKFKNNLKKHHLTFSLIEQIAEKIKQIPSHELLRVEIELVRTVCNIVENYVKSGNSKKKNPVDKKKLVVDALSVVYSHSEQEKLLINSLIDFLFNNDQIKKSSWFRLGKNLLWNWSKIK